MLTFLPCQAHDILPRKNTYIAGDKTERKQYYNKYIIIVSDTTQPLINTARETLEHKSWMMMMMMIMMMMTTNLFTMHLLHSLTTTQ